MKRFKKILIWVQDGSAPDIAVERGVAIARETGATLTLAHAVEEPQRLLKMLYRQAGELHGMMVHEWKEQLEGVAEPLRAEGLAVEVRVLEGKPYLAFIREVLREGHDLILKRAHGDKDGPFFGSSDMHLLRKCPCAVWLVRPGAPVALRILAAVDPDPRDDALNTAILEVASTLALMRGGTLDVVHAWELMAESLLASRVDAGELKRYRREARQQAAGEMDDLLKRVNLALQEDRLHLINGYAGTAIPEWVEQHDVGLLVMGTVCRVGIAGFLIGNTAESVLSRVRCSVLTLKPAGFVTPVELEDGE